MAPAHDETLEHRIAEALARGDLHAAAAQGIRGYGPQILGYLAALLHDRTAAVDAFDAFGEELWKGIHRFKGGSSFRTWAYAIAWHVAQRSMRDRRRSRTRRLETTEISKIVVEVRTGTAPHLDTAARDRLAKLRASLDPLEQTILILRFDRALTWKEVAEVLGEAGEPVLEATVRKRFARLRAKLRRAAAEDGIGSP